jgi:hypothetical protein
LTPDLAETSRQIEKLAARHRELAARIVERKSIPDLAENRGPAFPLDTAQRRTAILQPPKPEVPASPWILERHAARDVDREADG